MYLYVTSISEKLQILIDIKDGVLRSYKSYSHWNLYLKGVTGKEKELCHRGVVLDEKMCVLLSKFNNTVGK